MPVDVSEEIKKIMSEVQAAEQQSQEHLAKIHFRLEKIYSDYAEYLIDQDLIVLKLAKEILKEKEANKGK